VSLSRPGFKSRPGRFTQWLSSSTSFVPRASSNYTDFQYIQEEFPLIQRHIDEKKRGLSPERKNKIGHALVVVGRSLEKYYPDVTEEDIEDYIDALKGDDIVKPKDGEPYEHSTKKSIF
jgi:hypothetical protein